MKEHLTRVESHPHDSIHCSPEFTENIRKAKYYGLLFDSTLDQANREQMSEVMRYVEVDLERKSVRIRRDLPWFYPDNPEGCWEFS